MEKYRLVVREYHFGGWCCVRRIILLQQRIAAEKPDESKRLLHHDGIHVAGFGKLSHLGKGLCGRLGAIHF